MNEIEMLRNETLPVFIWGVETSAHNVEDELSYEGIPFQGFVTDKQGFGDSKDVWTKESVEKEFGEYAIIRGFMACYYMTDEEIMSQWPGCKRVYALSEFTGKDRIGRITKEYYETHRAEFETVRNSLADQLSIDSFDAYMKTRLELNHQYLMPYIVSPQYFFTPAPWTYSNADILLDGGGYDGDSILDFVNLRGSSYQKIITLEPDEENYNKLLDTVKRNSIDHVTAINKGLYNKTTTLKFDSRGDTGSSITSNGSFEINVCAIDDIAGNDPISIIKMDIEGSEMDALNGAKKTISRHRPILLLSAYHKKDDLFNIYEFVNDTVKDYSFFFRIHKPVAFDDVLYAVPNERLK